MGKYTINLSENARKDLSKIYKSGDKISIKKIDTIFEELKQNPYEGTGKPEALKYKYKGFWSRRINAKDKLIYEVREQTIVVFIVSALGHYNDK